MRWVFVLMLALGAGAWFLAGCSAISSRPLPTARRVDLQRYAGKWHEIARLPNRFQRDDADATAEYTLRPDGTMKVVNTEARENGKTKTIEGTATAVPGSNQSRLRVKFGGLAALAPVPKEGNYWIIQVEPDYSVVLVGTPDRRFLWLLARRDQLDSATLHRYQRIAEGLGFETGKMRLASTQQR